MVSLDPVDRETCDEYLMMVKELQDRLDRQLIRLEDFAAMKEFSEEVAKLKCFKGISTQTALALVTEVEDFQRFPTACELYGLLRACHFRTFIRRPPCTGRDYKGG